MEHFTLVASKNIYKVKLSSSKYFALLHWHSHAFITALSKAFAAWVDHKDCASQQTAEGTHFSQLYPTRCVAVPGNTTIANGVIILCCESKAIL